MESCELYEVLCEFSDHLEEQDYSDIEFIYLFDPVACRWYVMGFRNTGLVDRGCGGRWLPLANHRSIPTNI